MRLLCVASFTVFLLVLFLGTTQLYGQEPSFVRETCELLKSVPATREGQTGVIERQMSEYSVSSASFDSTNHNRLQDFYRFQFRWTRELIRTCPAYVLGEFNIRTQTVIDLEGDFKRDEIDSLKGYIQEISGRGIHLLLITVDGYYPAKSLGEFARTRRERWGQGGNFDKGGVAIVLSSTKREVRISTSETAMKYLTDNECTEIIDPMTPEFKKGNYYNGLVRGLNELKKRL